MKTIPTVQEKAYCRNCFSHLDPDELTQSWRAADEPVCPECGQQIDESHRP